MASGKAIFRSAAGDTPTRTTLTRAQAMDSDDEAQPAEMGDVVMEQKGHDAVSFVETVLHAVQSSNHPCKQQQQQCTLRIALTDSWHCSRSASAAG